ncbi:hypothetical protein EJ08DRAFT_612942 [Tothia fuscella]|uniref:PCI domain-containing protein n=1 Tax=Tothia fuscella TaxID=1048955 RepID=A0A9P4NQF9_9PEZI|nr:hypothetical protein EJ08DRAFT_612942 [Tothia fuscella]
MEQQRAINALEPYLALSKSAAAPRAAADLINQATSALNTFVFAELLHTPNINALRNSEDPSSLGYYRLLEIFAWGSWAEYQSTPNLPELSEQQQEKLRLLSLLPLARSQANLTYNGLRTALSLPNAKSLEKLVTKAIYSGLVTGTLDPHHQVVNITSVAPLRDLSPGSIPALAQSLTTWSSQCTATLASLQSQINAVKQKAILDGQQKDRVQVLIDEKVAAADKEESTRPKRGASSLGDVLNVDEDDEDAMDVDLQEGRGARRTAKRGGFGLRFG